MQFGFPLCLLVHLKSGQINFAVYKNDWRQAVTNNNDEFQAYSY